MYPINSIIIWLANFASFDWSIPGPITYGTDPDGLVTFPFFRFCFICTLFELVIFTNEIANHLGFDKRKPRARDKALLRLEKEIKQKLTMKIVSNRKY